MKCNNCGSQSIVSADSEIKVVSGNSLYVDRNFGRVKVFVEILWCADCGKIERLNPFTTKFMEKNI